MALRHNHLSLKHTVLFGIKGVSAYSDHAQILHQEDDSVYAYVHEGLAAIKRDDLSLEQWVDMAMRCGGAAVKNKDIRHFFLVAGCDGAKPGRNYSTIFIQPETPLLFSPFQ
jgi:hydroxylamine reductase (hybrid-cluster protein)